MHCPVVLNEVKMLLTKPKTKQNEAFDRQEIRRSLEKILLNYTSKRAFQIIRKNISILRRFLKHHFNLFASGTQHKYNFVSQI